MTAASRSIVAPARSAALAGSTATLRPSRSRNRSPSARSLRVFERNLVLEPRAVLGEHADAEDRIGEIVEGANAVDLLAGRRGHVQELLNHALMVAHRGDAPSRTRSAQRRQFLLIGQDGGERVARFRKPLRQRRGASIGPGAAPDRPARPMQIGMLTGAPGAGRVLYGATSVLLIAFWV